jgi:pSer/pThr/pTyr-binding forkhead associated (FHA) protein
MGLTFQILDGIDKGRIFRDLQAPVTIGREEGNLLRLNDERVSRFHAKVQLDADDVILTDLESTNGTRVNGTVVQIRRLRFGDRLGVGRSLLLFGSNEEIAQRMGTLDAAGAGQLGVSAAQGFGPEGAMTMQTGTIIGTADANVDFDVQVEGPMSATRDALIIGNRSLPPLPQKLTPSQAARLAEILDYLHRGLTQATENIQARDDGSQINLGYSDWQRVQAVHMLLARYLRAVAEPDTLSG